MFEGSPQARASLVMSVRRSNCSACLDCIIVAHTVWRMRRRDGETALEAWLALSPRVRHRSEHE
jgi:hypothetical protein